MKYLRSKKVVLGLLYLGIMLISSFSLTLFFKDYIPEPVKLLSENGKIIGTPPFNPMEMPPFGSDKIGSNLLFQILEGAKYTIILVVLISLLRLILGSIISMVYAYWLIPYKKWISGLFQVFYFVPTVVLAYILLSPLDFMENISTQQYICYQFLILVVIVVLPIGVTLGEEIHLQLQEDYIIASKLMGASRTWLLVKQLRPFLLQRMLILFMEQVVQGLSLFAQLGILYMFIGGRVSIQIDEETSEFFSLTNEWSGLVGKGFFSFLFSPWIALVPLGFFAFTIFCCNLIIKGLKEKMDERPAGTIIGIAAAIPLHTNKKEMFKMLDDGKKVLNKEV